jgi:hypothetical protein
VTQTNKETTMFIVIVPNYWGRGDSLLAASNVARRVQGKKPAKSMPKEYIAYEYDPKVTTKCYVDEMGAICWVGDRPKQVAKVGV